VGSGAENGYSVSVPTHPGKSWNLTKEFSRPGRLWQMTVVMESHGKVVEFYQYTNRSWNFLTEG